MFERGSEGGGGLVEGEVFGEVGEGVKGVEKGWAADVDVAAGGVDEDEDACGEVGCGCRRRVLVWRVRGIDGV